jgi:hypothetical protein
MSNSTGPVAAVVTPDGGVTVAVNVTWSPLGLPLDPIETVGVGALHEIVTDPFPDVVDVPNVGVFSNSCTAEEPASPPPPAP